MALWLDLASIYAPLGATGAVVAVVTATVAALAFGIGAPTGGGLATAGWLMGVLLSLCSAFAGDWIFPVVALVALPAALVLVVPVAWLITTRPRLRAATFS